MPVLVALASTCQQTHAAGGSRVLLFTVRGVTIEHDSPVPVYRQIAALLEADIRSGKLAPGARVPSESYIVGTYGVSRDTARKAIAVVRDAGLIVTTPGKGSYVA